MLKRIISLTLPAILLIGCGNDEPKASSNKDKSDESTTYPTIEESFFTGRWHFYSGTFNENEDYASKSWTIDKIFEFTTNHNYSETTTTCHFDWEMHIENNQQFGTWSLSKNTLILTDWYGESQQVYTITQVSDTRVSLIGDYGSPLVFVRCGKEFENLSNEILGYWYPYPSTKQDDYYNFKRDGFVTIKKWMNVAGSPLPTQGDSKWSISDNVIALTSYPVENKTDYYPVRCCNTTFLIMGNLVLKRSKWQ